MPHRGEKGNTARNDGSTTGKTGTAINTKRANADKATAKPGESMVGEDQDIGFYRSPKSGGK